jgi:hypothetical protein
MHLILAGARYFAVVFACGFAFGAIREMFVTPALGALAATLVEAPLMMAASYVTARWVVSTLANDPGLGGRLIIGASAFAFLLVTEMLFSVLFRGLSVMGWAAHFVTQQGALSLALFVAFAFMPAFVRAR